MTATKPLCYKGFRPFWVCQVTRRDVRHIDGETFSALLSQDRNLMAPLTAPAEAPSLSPAIEDRAVGATLACIARHGLAKTTFDDVAREAGCARATLYRYFGGKR